MGVGTDHKLEEEGSGRDSWCVEVGVVTLKEDPTGMSRDTGVGLYPDPRGESKNRSLV